MTFTSFQFPICLENIDVMSILQSWKLALDKIGKLWYINVYWVTPIQQVFSRLVSLQLKHTNLFILQLKVKAPLLLSLLELIRAVLLFFISVI